jgi:hypothetical protein
LPPEVAADVAIMTRAPQGELLQGTLPLLILRTLATALLDPQNGS